MAYCAFCSGTTGTRDHCPSKVFLDEPYPDSLPVVPACPTCNEGFSLDEQYVACLISCVVAGSTNPSKQVRNKVGRILNEQPSLRQRIEESRSVSRGIMIFQPEAERVASVVKKLAQGHVLYEIHELCVHPLTSLSFSPLHLLESRERTLFEIPDVSSVWPEVGSRMMQRLVGGTDLDSNCWIVVQPMRYRYHVAYDSCITVRIVIQDYLACQVSWNN